ncbi:MAG: DUF6427 family protein [Bacteroidales bacterium]
MFRFIKSISLASQILVPVIALILFIPVPFLVEHTRFAVPPDGTLNLLGLAIGRLPAWASVLIAFLLTLFGALLLNGSDLKHLLTGRRSYAIAFVFIFLTTSSGQVSFAHPALFSGIAMLIGNKYLLELYKSDSSYPQVFSLAFSWSLAGLIYPPVFFILPVMVFGIILMGSNTLRHFLVFLAGLVTPVGILLAVWYLIGNLDYELAALKYWLSFRFDPLPGFLRGNWLLSGWFILIFIWIAVASIGYRNPRVQSRRLFQTNFIQFLLTLAAAVLLAPVGPEIIWLLLIPVTYLLTFWLLEVGKGWKRDLFFISLLASWLAFLLNGNLFTL